MIRFFQDMPANPFLITGLIAGVLAGLACGVIGPYVITRRMVFLAGAIAHCLSDLVTLDVPTVSVLLGQGSGGPALAMVPADRVLAALHGWLAPLPPEGASAIVFRDTEHAPELAAAQGIRSADLLASGIVDVIVAAARDPRGLLRVHSQSAWSPIGLVSVRLTGSAGDAVVPNVDRPKGVQVWNHGTRTWVHDLDYGDPNEGLSPIRLAGTRNGAFSGQVVVGRDEPIKGLKARMSDLALTRARGTIPAAAVQVRYPKPTDSPRAASALL